ncbi:MAG: hypothetical protein KJ729_00070 [Euryarchaeota archaeon]|nr:hypothetical protein [Euryarchaeota archaeon]
MKTYKKEEFDNSTQRPEPLALGKVKGIKKGILINIDADRKHLKKDFPIPGWTGIKGKRYGGLTPMEESIFWLTFAKYSDKVQSLADLLIISSSMKRYLKIMDPEVFNRIDALLKEVVQLIPEDKTDVEELCSECRDIGMDV